MNPASIIEHIRAAAREGGIYLAIVVAVAALALAALAQFNPAEEAADHVGAPVVAAIGLSSSRCPSGWAEAGTGTGDVLASTCVKDPWVVTLNPDGSFDHALNTGDPNATEVTDPAEVPGWQ